MTIRVGLLGAGAISTTYREVFGRLDDAKIVAVADSQPTLANTLADSVGATSFPSALALLDEGGVDAIVVCTPPATHAGIAIQAIERRVHVLCEKPFSIDLVSAHDMLDSAQRADVICSMATKFRFVEDIIRAKAILESGILGEVIQITNIFASRVDMQQRWNSDSKISGGGVLIDNGTHSVDLIRYFCGPAAEIFATEGLRSQRLSVEETARMLIRNRSGVLASVELSWNYENEADSYLDIYGTQGTLHVGWNGSRYRQENGNGWVSFGSGYDKIECMTGQMKSFLNAVRKDDNGVLEREEVLSSVEMIDAAYRSIVSRQWVELDEVGYASTANGRNMDTEEEGS